MEYQDHDHDHDHSEHNAALLATFAPSLLGLQLELYHNYKERDFNTMYIGSSDSFCRSGGPFVVGAKSDG